MSINILPNNIITLALSINPIFNGKIVINSKHINCIIGLEPIVETTSKTYYDLITGEPYKYRVFKEPKQRWKLTLAIDTKDYFLNNTEIRNGILNLIWEKGNIYFATNYLRFLPEEGRTKFIGIGYSNYENLIVIEMEGSFFNTPY